MTMSSLLTKNHNLMCSRAKKKPSVTTATGTVPRLLALPRPPSLSQFLIFNTTTLDSLLRPSQEEMTSALATMRVDYDQVKIKDLDTSNNPLLNKRRKKAAAGAKSGSTVCQSQ